VAECARLICGHERRQREVVMTRQAKLGRWVKLIAPAWWNAWRWRRCSATAKPADC
jgi:hypothetical protein